MTELNIEQQRREFESAMLESAGHLVPDFTRDQVERGYSGYKDPKAEAAFCGWILKSEVKRAAMGSAEPVAWYCPASGGFWLSEESIPPHIKALGVEVLGKIVAPDADAKDVARAARNYITTSGTLDYVFQQVMASRSPDEQFNLLGSLVDAAIAVALKQVIAAQQPQAAASSLIGHNDDLPAGWTRAPDGRVIPPPGMTSEAYCVSTYAPPSTDAKDGERLDWLLNNLITFHAILFDGATPLMYRGRYLKSPEKLRADIDAAIAAKEAK